MMTSNRFSPLADLEPSLLALSQAVTTIMEKIHMPVPYSYKQALLKPEDPVSARACWLKSESQGDQSARITRSQLVRFKLEELRLFSTPSHPLCFRCGDRGHRALCCRNIVLCFACNRLGHRSSQCRSVIEPPHTQPRLDLAMHPPLTETLTISPCYELSIMASIKNLETELAAIKHELELMRRRSPAMESSTNRVKGSSCSPVPPPGTGTVDSGYASLPSSGGLLADNTTSKTLPSIGTNSSRTTIVPITSVGTGAGTGTVDSGLSQNARTKLKKVQSDSIEWNRVLMRESRGVQFKLVAEKVLRQEGMRDCCQR